MIYLLTLLTTLCIQLADVSYPVNMSASNVLYSSTLDSCISALQSHNTAWIRSAGNAAANNKDLCFLRALSDGTYILNMPKELSDSTKNSTISLSSRSNTGALTFSAHDWYGFIFNANLTYKGYGNNGGNFNSSIYVPGGDASTDVIVYNNYYEFVYDNVATFSFISDPIISGHTQTGKNDKILDSLPFPNAPTVSGHSSVSSVDDSSANNLLGNILNTLQIVGNTITSTGNNIITFISDLYGNINDTINYVIEPLNHDEVINIMKNSHYNGFFEDLKNVKDTFDNLSNSDHVILSFTLPSYLGGDSFSFDFAQYFNSSKHIWQPLLLTFLYASLVWGFYRGFANMVNGSSPFVSDVHYQFANDRLQREQASDNHTR